MCASSFLQTWELPLTPFSPTVPGPPVLPAVSHTNMSPSVPINPVPRHLLPALL